VPEGLYEQQGNNVTELRVHFITTFHLRQLSCHIGQLSIFKDYIDSAAKYGCDFLKWSSSVKMGFACTFFSCPTSKDHSVFM